MRFRILRSCSVFCACLLMMAFGGSVRLEDTRFTVTAVTLTGPATINNGASANYTVNITIRRNPGAPNVLTGTQGPPPPRIRPSLYAGSTQLTRTEINFGAGVNTATVLLSLNCTNNEVRGDLAGSGAGARAGTGFLGWPWWDSPASIVARLNERDSARMNVLCNS